MKIIFVKSKAFLLPYILFILLGGMLISLKSKADIHLFINNFHTAFLDLIFPYITLLGDGITLIIVATLCLFIKYRFAIILLLSYLFSSLITQGLKHLVFEEMVRPKKFFEGIHQLYFVQGVEVHSFNSFPSGHATTAFTLFFCLSLLSKNNRLKIVLFIVALTVGFSRVYLSQHFFNDIYAGSLIGVIVSFFTFHFIENSSFINRLKWIDQSLLKPAKK